jgi:putative intracellular protease/amidase
MRILMVVPSDDRAVASDAECDEILGAYYVFADSGAEVVLASPLGGPCAISIGRTSTEARDAAASRFRRDDRARAAFADTLRLDQAYASDFDAIFFPRGLDGVVPFAVAEEAPAAGPIGGYGYVVRDRALLMQRPTGSAVEAAAVLIKSLL